MQNSYAIDCYKQARNVQSWGSWDEEKIRKARFFTKLTRSFGLPEPAPELLEGG